MATYTPENWYVSNITCKMKAKINIQKKAKYLSFIDAWKLYF